MPQGWTWDETLFAGSAPYYVTGRLPYAPGLADELAAVLGLDGQGRLLDTGCGPGVLTLLLANRFTEAVGVDPDPGMLAEAARQAQSHGITNTRWIQARAEDLTPELGPFHLVTFGQSFHWMERARVAAIAKHLLAPGGAVAHVSEVKEPLDQPGDLPFPLPPYDLMRELVRQYLGPLPRAGQGALRHGSPDREGDVFRAAGFTRCQRHRVPAAGPVVRSTDDLVAWVYSLSSAAPNLFANRRADFEADLRQLLLQHSPAGWFSEQPPDTDLQLFWLPTA